MAPARSRGSRAALDVIGIGFGPANLALALCLEEEPPSVDGRPLRRLFLERKTSYEWHPDMLLEGAEVQVPFLKDLVTLRNPQSHFTFLNYLRLHGRLLDFVNLRRWFPTRLEFNHYYRWVAAQLADRVCYGRAVESVLPVAPEAPADAGGGTVELLQVTARNLETGRIEEYRTRNLVVATGGVPYVPPGIDVEATAKVFHSQSFLKEVRRHFPRPDAPYRFLVVGSGQSAAEIFQYLFSHYPNAEVTAALRRFAYKPADESEFVNEIYSPAMTDLFFGLADEERRYLTNAHADTNYSAVDLELIRSIFRALYEMKVKGDTRVRVRSLVELRHLEQNGAGIVARLWNKAEGRMECLEADGVVLATGFQRPPRHPLLAALGEHLLVKEDGEYQVGRDYRVATLPGFAPGIYLQGFCESTHGLSDAVLSVLPVRSREIADSLGGALAGATIARRPRRRRQAPGPPAAAPAAVYLPVPDPPPVTTAIPELELREIAEPALESGGR
jgi:L-ornithine N5-oxygenase